MSIDEQGRFWISDPWMAMLAIVAVVGLILWCHLRLTQEDTARQVPVPVRAEPPWRELAVRTVRHTVGSETGGCHERNDAQRRRVA